MKKELALIVITFICKLTFSQVSDIVKINDIDQVSDLVQVSEKEQLRLFKKFCFYGDAHIHPTYKHYFRFRTATEMLEILSAKSYDSLGNLILNPTIAAKFQNKNWEPYEKASLSAIRNGRVATIKKYDQSGYPEIKYVPGSIFCNSYSPYEKQFALKWLKRQISSLIVSGMGSRRLKTYSLDKHTPLNDFLAEYYFNLMQKEEDTVTTWSPDFLYRQDGKTYHKNPVYCNRIKMVRDGKELDSILNINKEALKKWTSFADTPHIITPMVMSVEGAQVLYGKLSGKADNILNPLNIHTSKRFFKGVNDTTLENIHKELLDNVDTIKNLPHRLFCIILGHFAQNHVVGFSKTLDREPDNVQHRALSTITRASPIRNNLIRKTYDGFNPGCERTIDGCKPTDFGLQIVRKFLDTSNTKYHKPTYIDVKHMDVKARIQYYYERRRYEGKFKVKIPIIASHFAVSGEKQSLAVATGLRPNFDQYIEVEDQRKFYNDYIFRYDWMKFMDGKNVKQLNKKDQVLDSFERAMYKSLNFLDKNMFDNSKFNPFKGFIPDENKIGWYYPWSINLFDEEIIEINKSDGFIGVMLDPRQLGANMPRYKNIKKDFENKFKAIADTLQPTTLAKYGLTKNDVNDMEYFKTEPFIRNIFYIIQVIKNQQKAETYYKDSTQFNLGLTQKKYPDFIRDSSYCLKDAWKTIGIGGDFDGFIDPIDFCPTASYIPILHKRMIIYAYIFAQIHKNDFTDPITQKEFITTLEDSDYKMQQFFYSNLQEFIYTYF